MVFISSETGKSKCNSYGSAIDKSGEAVLKTNYRISTQVEKGELSCRKKQGHK